MVSDLLPFGILRRPHGVHGELVLHPYGGPSARPPAWQLPARVFVADAGGPRELTVAAARVTSEGYLVRLQGVVSRDEASLWVGKEVSLAREALGPLGPGEFFVEDIVGCVAVREGGEPLGRVSGTYWNGAQDIMVLAAEDGVERLLPVLPAYVLRFDPERRLLVVDPHD